VIDFYQGDYVVEVKGNNKAYLVQALEPSAPDSYFAWNLFDEILQPSGYFPVYFLAAVCNASRYVARINQKIDLLVENKKITTNKNRKTKVN